MDFEHALSVRLAVDELTGICRQGTVVVEEFMAVRERGPVQHLASRVGGHLDDHRGPWDAFAALFPAITATVCPEPEALRAISRYESEPRGLYAGSVFTAGADGSLDAALVLRTAFQRDGRSWLCAGAGVMGQSTPEREWEETCEKLRSVAPLSAWTPATGDPVRVEPERRPVFRVLAMLCADATPVSGTRGATVRPGSWGRADE